MVFWKNIEKPMVFEWFSMKIPSKFSFKFWTILGFGERIPRIFNGLGGVQCWGRFAKIDYTCGYVECVTFATRLLNGFWRFFRDFIIDQFCRSRKNDRFPLDRWPFLDVNVVHAIPFCIFFKKISWSHLAQSGFSSGYTSIPNGRSIRV